jgi:hypothetical protein
LGGKIWAEITQIKVQYFVLKSLIKPNETEKKSPTTASESTF